MYLRNTEKGELKTFQSAIKIFVKYIGSISEIRESDFSHVVAHRIGSRGP